MAPKARQLKLKGKSLASRLTGISTPWIGVSWNPPEDERAMARSLLTYLEDRRALYNPYDIEIGDYVIQSILEIRRRLTDDLQRVDRSTVLGESMAAMRAACRQFADETQGPRGHRHFMEPHLLTQLGQLRAIFGVHVARLASAYDLEVETDLASILPPDTREDLQ